MIKPAQEVKVDLSNIKNKVQYYQGVVNTLKEVQREIRGKRQVAEAELAYWQNEAIVNKED